MTHFYDQWGRKREWDDVRAVDALVKLKRESGSNPWPVIEMCLEIWKSSNPNEWKSFLVDLGKTKVTRKDRKFASTYDKVHGGYLRYTLDLPEKVVYMIRALYSSDELKMDREFFIEFAKRFPLLKVAERL